MTGKRHSKKTRSKIAARVRELGRQRKQVRLRAFKGKPVQRKKATRKRAD